MSARLANKTAIITGAGQGIGAAIAEAFAEQGAALMLLDTQLTAITTLAKRLEEHFARGVLVQKVDISNKFRVDEAIELAVEKMGRVDILVNNAGINVFTHPLDTQQADWDKCLGVNLQGAWYCAQAVLPHMLAKRYGHIVNIASVHGHKVVRGAFPYALSKHALIGMTRTLGVEYADQGIRVNSISPGLIDTPIADAYFDSCGNPAQERQRQRDILPCKRFGHPKEVANTAVFLASDEAKFINATDILIDGGRSQVYCD